MPLLITRADVDEMFRRDAVAVLDALLARVEAGLREIAAGTVCDHHRIYLRIKDSELRRPPGLFSSSALLGGLGRMGTRLLALGGPGAGGDGLVVLFELATLTCLAIVDDRAVHRFRTGTTPGIATRLLARPDARTIGVLGSSGIAEGTLRMACHVRPSIERVRVFSPSMAHRERFADRMAHAMGIAVLAVASAEEAVDGADIVVTATDADRAIVPDATIAAGTHINAMGRNELGQATLARSRIVLGTSRAFYRSLDPPWHEPLPEACIAGDLSEALTASIAVRTSPSDVTAFVSAGSLAMLDVSAASAVFDLAQQYCLGKEISLES